MSSHKEQYERAKEEGRVRPLSPRYFEFKEEGDAMSFSLIGVLRGITSVQPSVGEGGYCQYLIETDEGMVIFVLGAGMDREIKGLLVAGSLYSFTFLGRGGRQVNRFAVEVVTGESGGGPKASDGIPF